MLYVVRLSKADACIFSVLNIVLVCLSILTSPTQKHRLNHLKEVMIFALPIGDYSNIKIHTPAVSFSPTIRKYKDKVLYFFFFVQLQWVSGTERPTL